MAISFATTVDDPALVNSSDSQSEEGIDYSTDPVVVNSEEVATSADDSQYALNLANAISKAGTALSSTNLSALTGSGVAPVNSLVNPTGTSVVTSTAPIPVNNNLYLYMILAIIIFAFLIFKGV